MVRTRKDDDEGLRRRLKDGERNGHWKGAASVATVTSTPELKR